MDESLITSFIYSNPDFVRTQNKEKSNTVVKEKSIDFPEVEYIGGHIAYPKSECESIRFYHDRMNIWFTKKKITLTIPYSSIIDIDNAYEKKVSVGWVMVLAILFLIVVIIPLLWKKKHIYTVIDYRDATDEQKITLDFEINIEYALSG